VSSYLASTFAIDFVIVFIVLEALLLLVWRTRSCRALPPVAIVLMLAPGMSFLLALRAALAAASWPWVPLALVAALVFHLGDLRTRLLR
jgi:hypothetical protein